MNIDASPVEEILKLINEEDRTVPLAVEKALPAIASLVEDTVSAFARSGRLVYVGAGTSGRLGVLDASECPPTFGVDPSMVVGIIAGGDAALRRSVEGAEDDAQAGRAALEQIGFASRDVLVGITASGSAPFVLGAMRYARGLGAKVGAISCNKGSKTFELADHKVLIDVGPEVITGSTRLKAGTAQKLVLNMLTTASMVRFGKVYGNLMVDLTPVNKKLVDRSKRLIRQATGCTADRAEKAFAESGGKPKLAIVMVLLGVQKDRAKALIEMGGGRIADAVRLHDSTAADGKGSK
jgi:N-acetylmuramic acid 6-phosphate etherase